MCAWAERPNVVIFMADDIGLGDVAFYHRERTGETSAPVPTPNLDRLIQQGMRFSDAHSPAALCAPTRFSMLTGNYPFRNAKPNGVWAVYANPLIDPQFTTVARIARQGGYRTAFFGKWGLGGNWTKKPQTAVDFESFSAGALSYGFDYALELPAGIQNLPFAFYENRKYFKLKEDSILKHIPIEQTGYDLTLDKKAVNYDGMGDSNWDPALVGPVLVKKAEEFIKGHLKDHKEQPFFIYFCSQAVHTPHVAAKEINGQKTAGLTAGPLGDFIHELDLQVGALFKVLEETGALENTLFVFTSDNGGLPARWDRKLAATGHRSNGDLAAQKGSIMEGGHRVPFIAVWKNQIEPNSECNEPMVSHDLVATICQLTDYPIDRSVIMDSYSLLPLFQGKQQQHDRYLIHQSGGINDFAIRKGPWKLIIDGDVRGRPKLKRNRFDVEDHAPVRLFNFESSPIETDETDVFSNPENSSLIKSMFEKYVELRSAQVTHSE
ncbi:MAG: arylsulfatase [Verrucomicrobiota bacterium]